MMNITEESNQNNSNNLFSTLQWNQGPPHYSPWGHSPNSPPAPLVTFNAQSTQMDQQQSGQNDICYGQSIINNVNNQLIGSTNSFGHNISVCNNQPIASTSSFGDKPLLHCKRKANIDFSVPNKQHITEEKMAQHMSRLHISSETHVENVSSSDIEDTTTRQKRLYVCEEMRRLQTENILPTALLGRLERPCMAVMLWQPPAKIPELICPSQMQNMSRSNASVCSAMVQAGRVFPRPRNSQNLDEDENDNSSGTINLNNMEMDS